MEPPRALVREKGGLTLGRQSAVSLEIRAFGRSDVGRVRGRNEDTVSVEPSNGMVVVADGMGGAPAGDFASSLAVQEVARSLHAGGGMEEAIQRANRKLLDTVDSRPALAGMGTTLTALRIDPETSAFVLGHVGDSRAYRLSDGDFRQMSRDHTMVRDMVEAGKIPASAEREHPLGHILTRVLGAEDPVEVDLLEGVALEGDSFLLCSDGLAKVMEDGEVEEWLRRVGELSLDEVVDTMVEEANRRGAPDNITVAILTVGGPPPS